MTSPEALNALPQGALGLLAGFLAVAVWQDCRTRRIPNRLILLGILTGLALNALLPLALGQAVARPGVLGLMPALAGAGLGLAVFLPLYALRTLGAGDVKLLAMVGAFVGPQAVLGVTVATLVAGGVLALAFALRARILGPVLHNVAAIVQNGLRAAAAGALPTVAPLSQSLAKLPYSLAIAAGTVGYLTWQHCATPGRL